MIPNTEMALFAGIGGFPLAARKSGWHTPVMVEWNPYCQEVLKKNFKNAELHGDIRKFDGRPWRGKIGVITGGFPCQPFSSAGKRDGANDNRYLWPEMLRVVREVAPPWVIGENVAGLLTMDRGRVFSGILTDLENEGYSTETYLIPAIGVGAPHERYRVWIIAHRDYNPDSISVQSSKGRKENENANAFRQVSPSSYPAGIGRIWWQNNKGQEQAKGYGSCGFNQENSSNTCVRGWNQTHHYKCICRRQPHINNEHWSAHWFEVATRICRVDDGIPTRMDGTGKIPSKTKKKNAGQGHRLEGLGNAIVPEIAERFFQAINEFESKKTKSCQKK